MLSALDFFICERCNKRLCPGHRNSPRRHPRKPTFPSRLAPLSHLPAPRSEGDGGWLYARDASSPFQRDSAGAAIRRRVWIREQEHAGADDDDDGDDDDDDAEGKTSSTAEKESHA